MNLLSQHAFDDITVRYLQDETNGRVGLQLIPTARLDQVVTRRTTLRGLPFIDAMPGNDPFPAAMIDSLVQLKLVGDAYPGAFAQGHTLRESGTVGTFRFVEQRVERREEMTTVLTILANGAGCRLEHSLDWQSGEKFCTVATALFNHSSAAITLELLSSFSLGGITPFAIDDAPGQLSVHRFRSCWSAEG